MPLERERGPIRALDALQGAGQVAAFGTFAEVKARAEEIFAEPSTGETA